MKNSRYFTILALLAVLVIGMSSCSKKARSKDTAYKYSARFL